MSIPSRIARWIPASRAALEPGWYGLEPTSRVTELGDFRIHSLEFGAGEQEVVLLHGLSGSALWWHRNVRSLAGRYRVLLPELVGFGRSPAAGRLPSIGETAELLERWMEALGLGRVHLVGHSMGGQISIHLAARHPGRIDRLVLVDAAGIPRPRTTRKLLRFALELTPLWRWGDPLFLPTIVRDTWAAGGRTVGSALRHIVLDDVRPLLPRIGAPTLIIWGERDSLVPLVDAGTLRGAIPRSELAVLRGAAHNPMVDRPRDFDRLVLRFLGGERVGR